METQRAKRIGKNHWLAQKPNLEKLWLNEKRPMREVIEIMKKKCNFNAT